MTDTAEVTERDARPAPRPRRRRRGKGLLHALAPLLWLGRPIALIGVVVLWPVYVMFKTSFQRFHIRRFNLGAGRLAELQGPVRRAGSEEHPDSHGRLGRGRRRVVDD